VLNGPWLSWGTEPEAISQVDDAVSVYYIYNHIYIHIYIYLYTHYITIVNYNLIVYNAVGIVGLCAVVLAARRGAAASQVAVACSCQ
jgi:hypothetical protein